MNLRPEHRSALAVLGRAIQGALAARDMTASTAETASEAPVGQLTGDELRLCTDGRWYPRTESDAPVFADGLTTAEALGVGLAMRWSADSDGVPVRLAPSGRWRICLPTSTFEQWLTPADALPIAHALLTIRRVIRPVPRWGLRDSAAETIALHIRAMSAALRGPTPVEILHPPVTASDLGRDWSGGYL